MYAGEIADYLESMHRYVSADAKERREIGRELRALRKRKGLNTQRDLAKKAGVGVETISRLENGANVEVDTLSKVWGVFAVDVNFEEKLSARRTKDALSTLELTPEQREAQEVAASWLRLRPRGRQSVRETIETFLELQQSSPGAEQPPDADTTQEAPPAVGRRRAR